MTLQQLLSKLKALKARGFVRTVRAHQGGVGNTLEHHLGVKENNLKLPDWGKIEIKAKRIDSDSMLTLSSRAPLPRGTNKILFEAYKYKDPNLGYYKLYSTVNGAKTNNRGFRVKLDQNMLILENIKNIKAYWPLEELDDVMRVGSKSVLLVLAGTKGEVGKPNEKFHYLEAYLLSGLNIGNLQNAIINGHLKVDIRIGMDLTGVNAGKYHDHGTGFRVFKRDYLRLFAESKRLI